MRNCASCVTTNEMERGCSRLFPVSAASTPRPPVARSSLSCRHHIPLAGMVSMRNGLRRGPFHGPDCRMDRMLRSLRRPHPVYPVILSGNWRGAPTGIGARAVATAGDSLPLASPSPVRVPSRPFAVTFLSGSESRRGWSFPCRVRIRPGTCHRASPPVPACRSGPEACSPWRRTPVPRRRRPRRR